MARPAFTLSDLAKRLGVPQHRLIHLCEKGVVRPDLQDAAGRGSSRVFSARNLLELAVAVRLREMMLPVAAVGAIVHVLRAFEDRLRRDLPGFALPESLRGDGAPELRILLSDGRSIFFSVGRNGEQGRLFGGIPLDEPMAPNKRWKGKVADAKKSEAAGFGAPEGSRFGRLELSVTAIARELPLD